MRNYYVTNRNNNGYDFFNDCINSIFSPAFEGRNEVENMKTDVEETDNGYELSVEVPGFDKKEVKLSLENGYLTVSGERNETEENGKKKNYLRRERKFSCKRSFYVGDNVSEKDIKARYENGVLSVYIPKETEKKNESHLIAID